MDAILDTDEHYVMARDIREDMLVDFERLYRDFGKVPPEWSRFEYSEITEVLSEDIVSLYAVGASFGLSREHAVVVFGPLPEDYVEIGRHNSYPVYGSLDG